MGAGASAGAAAAEFDELAAFRLLVMEYEKRGKLLTDQEEGFAAMKEMWLKLARGEELIDESTLVEKLGHVAFKEHRQGVIDAVFRLQASRKKGENLKEGENYVIEGIVYNTAEDAAAEREFASVLIGHDGGHHTSEEKDQGYVTLNTAEEANTRDGMWERINADPVFYINDHTAEVCFLRPDNVNKEQEQEAIKAKEAEAERGFATMHILKMPEALEEIWKAGKTPLIIDESSGDQPQTAAFFSYKGVLLDAKPIGLGFSKTGKRTEEILEEFRSALVGALKAGQKRVAIDLGHFAPNFKELLATKKNSAIFPLNIFKHGEISKKIHARKIFRDEDKVPPGPKGKIQIMDNTRICVITHVPPAEALEHLKESFPLEYFQPLHVYSRA
ncbi:hypothetical protein N9362_00165 [bacterium]|jgi:hypothetical protein|nr:hypothetical protein [bacterium]